MAYYYFDEKSKLNSFLTLFFLLLLLFINASPVFSKSPRPITDVEIRQIKNECYADIESGLWGQQCKTSMTAKENCALKCLSPICYELIYESDPLEEGEKDITRSQEYKYCMYNPFTGVVRSMERFKIKSSFSERKNREGSTSHITLALKRFFQLHSRNLRQFHHFKED